MRHDLIFISSQITLYYLLLVFSVTPITKVNRLCLPKTIFSYRLAYSLEMAYYNMNV